MAAGSILRSLTARGLTVATLGDRISVTPGGVLDDDLRSQVCEHRAAVLAALRALEAAVADLPIELGELIGALSARDLDGLAANLIDADALRAFAVLRAQRAAMARGEVPAHYTAATTCGQCGAVPIWQGAPQRLAACPWCRNRLSGQPVPAAQVARPAARASP